MSVGLRLFNTSSRQVLPLASLLSSSSGVLNWYMCGPTVYDVPHIGHARCYVSFDIVRRLMQHTLGGPDKVCVAMGITDVDDKIITKSMETQTPAHEIAKKYTHEFFHQLDRLHVLRPDHTLPVTDHMDDIINMVDTLVHKDHAYLIPDDGVYFSIANKRHAVYDVFGRHRTSDAVDDDKDNNNNNNNNNSESDKDFCLWKLRPEADELLTVWDSPWGPGRPGWHIECSAVVNAVFGDELHVHSGGVDLQFPHHTNEIAQSCAFHDSDDWAKCWMHAGHLHIQGRKMSKSLKNFITIDELLEDTTSQEFRTWCLLNHYRKNVEWSPGKLEEARRVYDYFHSGGECSSVLSGVSGIDMTYGTGAVAERQQRVWAALNKDVDTRGALLEMIHLLEAEKGSQDVRVWVDSVLGVLYGFNSSDQSSGESSQEVEAENKRLIEVIQQTRQRLRQQKLFELADSLRDALTAGDTTDRLHTKKKKKKFVVADTKLDD